VRGCCTSLATSSTVRATAHGSGSRRRGRPRSVTDRDTASCRAPAFWQFVEISPLPLEGGEGEGDGVKVFFNKLLEVCGRGAPRAQHARPGRCKREMQIAHGILMDAPRVTDFSRALATMASRKQKVARAKKSRATRLTWRRHSKQDARVEIFSPPRKRYASCSVRTGKAAPKHAGESALSAYLRV
jgi:hypothetical protein